MLQSDEILVCRVQPSWYNIVKNEYISAGSSATNFWTLKEKDPAPELVHVKPGTLVIYVMPDNGHQLIVGGGYFVSWGEQSPKIAWERFGVRNGSSSYADLLAEIKRQGGDEHSMLVSSVLFGTFIFSKSETLLVPDEFKDEFTASGTRFILSLKEPLGLYLKRILRDRRAGLKTDEYSSNWRGIYYLAAKQVEHSDIDGFYAAVQAAYGSKCAITGSACLPLLDVANIQPCYSNTFQSVQNGILMRTDFHRLFSEGFMTLCYQGDEAIVIKVSASVDSVGAGDYKRYDGQKLTLPQDKALWPKREYLEWHRQKCFEHWLHIGGTPA